MDNRWGISVDVEGFSANYEYSENRKTFAISALGELMNAVYRIGSLCFPGTPETNYSERLFAHQFGDGFIVCSEFPEEDVLRAIAISVAILRHLILSGVAAKAAISTGDLSGIQGCYPKPMCDSSDERIHLGNGLMTIIPVMGTALTKAHKLGSSVKGSVVVVDRSLIENGLPQGIKTCGPDGNLIDWISSSIPLAEEIAHKSGLRTASHDELSASLNAYVAQEPKPPADWVMATLCGLGWRG